jgi:divalent metal cation (Fe/Co/Zn/Cd) transporter
MMKRFFSVRLLPVSPERVMVDHSPRYVNCQRLLLAALWFELLAFMVKLLIGGQTHSLMVLASSLYSAIAAVSAVYAIVATHHLQRYGRPVWGHYRWETGLALGLVGCLGYGGLTLASLGLHALAAAPQLHQLPPLMIQNSQMQVLLLFGFVSLGLAWMQKRSGGRDRLLTLLATGNQVLQEALVSLGLLFGLMGVQLGYGWLDPLLAVGLSCGAGLSAWRMLLRQMPLMVRQVAIDPMAIAQVVRQVDGVTNCDQVESRGIVGRQVVISLRVMIHPEFLGTEGKIMQYVEALLRQTYGPVKVNVQVDSDWQGLQSALIEAENTMDYHPETDRHGS